CRRSPSRRRPTSPSWRPAWRRRRWCGCRCCPTTCTTSPGWPRWPTTSSTPPAEGRGRARVPAGSAAGGGQGGGGLRDRRGDRGGAVEGGGVEQPGGGGAAARDGDVAAGLPGAADAADQRAEAGRVHERDLGQVDQQRRGAGQLGQGLAELAHRVGVQL